MSVAHQIPVLAKALRVVEVIGEQSMTPMTLGGLARALKIAPATAYRIVQTFVQDGWVRFDEERRCSLGPQLLRLAELVPQQHRLRAMLEELRDETGLTCKASFREGDEAVTMLRVNSRAPVALTVQAASRFHLTLGSSGAILLAAMKDVEVRRIIKRAPASCWEHQNPSDVWARVGEARATGTCVDLGGYRPDIFGVSAGYSGGSITLTGLRHGWTKAKVTALRARLAAKVEGL
jgi:DNA-binding IclR family transcriptional regulator